MSGCPPPWPATTRCRRTKGLARGGLAEVRAGRPEAAQAPCLAKAEALEELKPAFVGKVDVDVPTAPGGLRYRVQVELQHERPGKGEFAKPWVFLAVLAKTKHGQQEWKVGADVEVIRGDRSRLVALEVVAVERPPPSRLLGTFDPRTRLGGEVIERQERRLGPNMPPGKGIQLTRKAVVD